MPAILGDVYTIGGLHGHLNDVAQKGDLHPMTQNWPTHRKPRMGPFILVQFRRPDRQDSQNIARLLFLFVHCVKLFTSLRGESSLE